MKKGKRNRIKIIEILTAGHMNGSQIQEQLNKGMKRYHVSVNEIAMLCRTSKHIEKKGFQNETYGSIRCRQVIWGLKE